MMKDSELTYKTPIYIQLREIIRSKIDTGEYPAGTAIPPENELADTYGVNRFTVRSAVDVLVKEGMLRRMQGKGVFVVGDIAEGVVERFDGYDLEPALNEELISIKNQSKTIRPAGDKYARIFGIETEDPIYYVKQMKYREAEVISLEEEFLPYRLLPELEKADLSVFGMEKILAFYNITASVVRQRLEIIEGSERVRHLLDDVPEGIAILMLVCTYEDDRGKTIRYKKSYIRSDKFRFHVSLHS